MISDINHCGLFGNLLRLLDLKAVRVSSKICINIGTKLH